MDKLSCGCTPDASGFGYCSECTAKLRKKIWNKMSKDKKDYDRHFAPEESKLLDESSIEDLEEYYENRGCTCHINPPCSYCVNKDSED